MSREIVNLYCDGSFNGKNASWGFIVVDKNNKILYKNKGILAGEINKMYQIGGEIYGCIEGIKYCISAGFICKVYYDYQGLQSWVADIYGGKVWKAKNEWSQMYRNFIIQHKQHINSFNKVKSHSGNKFNEEVDKLIKQ